MSDALYREYPAVYDALYANKPYDAEVAFVTEYVDPGDRVLVVGCGTGEHSRRLRERGVDVTGVDPSEAMLERARTKSDARFVVGALPDLPVDGAFDLVFVPFTVVNHLEPGTVDASLDALVDRLASGGTLVCDTMTLPDEGTDLTLEVHDRTDGQYARLFQVHARGDDRYRWHSLVFTSADWFVDTHDLLDVPPAALVDALEDRGLAVDTTDGYSDASGWPATVVVAQDSGNS